MAYDLLIKNGLVVDGSGMPAFRGDVGVKDGKIAEIGKLSGTATKTIDADDRAQSHRALSTIIAITTREVTWDPLFAPSRLGTARRP
jgi:N-acyl-D-aspartate/D-glutamate deacylase